MASSVRIIVVEWFRLHARDCCTMGHLMLSVVLVGMGAVLLYPGDTLSSGPGYAIMREMMPEWGWSVFFLVCGAVGFMGVAAKTRAVEAVSAIVLALAHLLVALCIAFAHPISLGTFPFSGLAVMAMGGLLFGRRTA